MKKLYFSVCSFGFPTMGVILEKILEDKAHGDNVILTYCKGALPSCDINVDGNTGACKLCHYMYHNITKMYLDGVKIVPLTEDKKSVLDVNFSISRLEDMRQIKYKGVCIGMSILSFYISRTRKMEGELTSKQKHYFNTLLIRLAKFVDIALELIEREKPDSISVYNGRKYDNRLFYDIAMQKGLKFESLEVVGGPLWHEDKFYRTQYEDGLPHNIHNYQKQMDKVWNDNSRTEQEKIELGSSFYYKRRTGQPAADIIFTQNMVDNLLPEDYDKAKKNIVIFNSSDDEKAALGGEWDEGKLFPTQYDAIEFVAQHAPENAHVYLRIHPNLSKIKYSYHTDLYKLKKYNNLTIIEPTSPISSYALMDIADQVVVFGSAMGVEGCFWGKPVLLLWKSLYYELDTCYVPRTQSELIEMLHSDLKPKNKINAIKYGLYNLDRKVRVYEDSYININWVEKNLFGFRFHVVDYLKIFKSRTAYRMIEIFCSNILFKFFKNNTSFPAAVQIGTQTAE